MVADEPENWRYSRQHARCALWMSVHKLRPQVIEDLAKKPLSAMQKFNSELRRQSGVEQPYPRRQAVRHLLAEYPKFFPDFVPDSMVLEDFVASVQPSKAEESENDDLMPIAQFPPHSGALPELSEALLQVLGTWLRRNNLDFPWCWNFSLRQLDRWATKPDLAGRLEPHVPLTLIEPLSGAEIVRRDVAGNSGEVGAPHTSGEDGQCHGPYEVRWGGGHEARYLPPELHFRMDLAEG